MVFNLRVNYKFDKNVKLYIKLQYFFYFKIEKEYYFYFIIDKNLILLFSIYLLIAAQKMKFSIKNFFSKCHQIHAFIPPENIRKPDMEFLMENFFFFCAVYDED